MATQNSNITLTITGNARQAQSVLRQVNTAITNLQALNQRANATSMRGIGSINRGLLTQSNLISGLTRRVLSLGAAYAGARVFAGFIREGLKFNEIIETAQLGIASIITATSEVRDPFGQAQKGAAALETALVLATDQVNKLRVAGLQTAATTDELVQAFQSATAAGIAAGLTLDEIRKVTVQVVQAAGNIGLPMQQLEQEVRSILSATIDRNSRVARVLNITNEEVRLHRQLGDLQEFLNKKLEAFTTSGEKAMETWRVLKSNMQEAFQVFSGVSVEPMFEEMRRAGQKALSGMFDFREARISDRFQPLVEGLQIFFAEFGERIGAFVDAMLFRLEGISQWAEDNREKIGDISDAFFDVVSAVGQIFIELGHVVGALTNVATEGQGVEGVFRAIQVLVETLANVLHTIAVGIERIGSDRGIRALTALALTIVAVMNPAKGATIILALLAAKLGSAAAASASLRAEEDARARTLETNNRLTSSYVREILRLNRELDDTKSEVERAKLLERRAELIEKLNEINPRYANTLRNEKRTTAELAEDIIRLNAQQIHNLTIRLAILKAQRAQISATAEEFQTQRQADRQRLAVLEAENTLRKNRIATRADQFTKAELAEITEINRRLAEQPRLRAGQAAAIDESIRATERELLELRKMNKEASARGSIIPGGGDPDRLKDDARRKAENDLRQEVQALIELRKKQQAAEEAALKAELAQNLITFQTYYDRLEAIQKDSVDDQIFQWNRLLRVLEDKGERAQVEGEIGELGFERAKDQTENLEELREARKKLLEEINEIDLQLLEATGQYAEFASEKVLAEMKDLRARIAIEFGQGSREFGVISQLIDHKRVRAAVDAVDRDMDRLGRSIELEMAGIELARESWAATEEEVLERIVKVYERQLNETRDALNKILAENEGVGNAEARERIEQLTAEVANLEVALQQAKNAANVLGIALRDIVTEGLSTFLSTGLLDAFNTLMGEHENVRQQIEQTADAIDAALEAQGVGVQQRTMEIQHYINTMREELDGTITFLDMLKEAFRQFAYSVVTELQKVIAQMIAFRIMQAAISAFGGAASSFGGQVGDFTSSGTRFSAASGGFIWGPGTETSDSIPARLSKGEYVLRAAVVKNIGVDTLDRINFGRSTPRMKRHRFAVGGVVDAPSAAGTTQRLDGNMTVGLEEGLVLRHIQTPAGQRALIKTVMNNQRAFKRALGL